MSFFAGNKVITGGGLLFSQDSFKIFNALFIGNSASDDGGGFAIISPTGSTFIYNSTFINNEATTQGGGFNFIDPNFVFTSLPVIKNTVFFNNNASDGTGGNINGTGIFVDLRS